MEFGRCVEIRGAQIFAIGRREVARFRREGIELAGFEGMQVVVMDGGAVVTVYRNRDFKGLRPRRRNSWREVIAMGWASYHEDIVSRYNGSPRVRVEFKRDAKRRRPSKTAPRPFRERVMSKLNEFTASTARPLPVLLLADVSGSMNANGKIDALNDAVQEMLESFGGQDDSRAEIQVAVVTFGQGGAKVHQPLAPASKIRWTRMAAQVVHPWARRSIWRPA